MFDWVFRNHQADVRIDLIKNSHINREALELSLLMEEAKMSSIDVGEMALRWITKAGVYKVLSTTGGIYLHPVDQINCDFVRDILFGDKLVNHLISHFVVHRVRQGQDYRGSSYWGFKCNRVIRVGKSPLRCG